MDTMVADALVGMTVDGRYRIDARLASGGMATVYRAIDNRLDRPVALKVMRSEFAEDPDFVARFQQEARAAARLSHPNVVAVFDQGEADGLVYLAMEYVDGRTLRDVLRDRGRLTPSQALAVLDPVLQGVSAAHDAGFIHRDIKPENVLVPDKGTIKVTDFGLARALQRPNNATTGLLIGTAAYLAPEQVSSGHSDERSDVYQAGILLFEMLAGQLPHTGDNAWSVAYRHVQDDVPSLGEVAPGTPEALEDLVGVTTQRDPDARPATIAAFRARAQSIAEDLPPPQPLIDPARLPDHTRTKVLADTEDQTQSTEVEALESPSTDGGTAGGTEPEAALVPASSLPPVEPPRTTDPAADREPPNTAKPKAKKSRRPWVIGFLVTLGLIAVTALAAWTVAANPFNRADIPDLVGVDEAKAESRLDSAGFVPIVADRQFSETAPAGTVISSDPESGAGARVGSDVDLVISMGPERYAVPNVRDMTPAEASTALEEANLKVGETTKKYHDDVEIGDVIKTVPKQKSKVKRDTAVELVVSKGPAPVDVPNVVGMGEAYATQQLENLGLNVSTSGSDYSESVDEGRVMSSSPPAGIEVFRGDTVSIAVSKGPPPVEVPNVVDMNRGEAESRLRALGFRVEVSEGPVTPLNRVFSQDPEAGTSLPKGSKVTISVF